MSELRFLRRCCRRALAWSVLALVWSLPAWSDVVQAAPPASSFASLLQVILGLGLVLGAIAGTAWLLRRVSPGQVAASGALRVVGGVAVGPKERVVLVDVGETRLVLGVAPGQVTTLHQMPRPPQETLPEDPTLLSNQFAQRLMQALGKRRNDAPH